MAINLDDGQREFVALRRQGSNRPDYYNASLKKRTQISEDFEAFLILQGRQRNSETVNWLELAQDLTVLDSDRDALAAAAYKKDAADASASERELSPLIRLFTRFKESYALTGFEEVAEAGLLLADIQKPMLEIQSMINRLRHRQFYADIGLGLLRTKGVTTEQQNQINSWFGPLAAY